MLAAWYANVSLVKFIVEHADKKIIDLRDSLGESAIFNATLSKGSVEKITTCVRLLIEAGADMNLRTGDIARPAVELNNSYFQGNNALGNLVEQVAADRYTTEEDKQRDLTIIQLLVDQGAICIHASDTLKGDRCTYHQILENVKDDVLWEKKGTIVCLFGTKSLDSPMANIPSDIANLIIEQMQTI